MHQTHISHAAAFKTLIVKEHLVYLPFCHTVPVIVKGIHSCLCVVIMTGEHHAYIGIFGNHFIVYSLRFFSHSAAGKKIFVEVQDCFSLRIPGQHLIHPVDLLIANAPSHIEHDKVHTVYGDQIIVASVVLITASVPGILIITVLSEIFPVVGVISA